MFEDIVNKAAQPPEPWDEHNAAARVREILEMTKMDSFLASLCGLLSIQVDKHHKPQDIQRMIYREVQKLTEVRERAYYDSWKDGTYQNGL